MIGPQNNREDAPAQLSSRGLVRFKEALLKLQLICRLLRKKGLRRATLLAEAEEFEVVGGHAETPETLNTTVERGEHLLPKPAAFEVLHLPALLADEMMVMSGEGLGEFKALGPLRFVGDADDS